MGGGLTIPLDRVEVTLAPGQTAALLSTEGGPADAGRWSLRDELKFVGGPEVSCRHRRECSVRIHFDVRALLVFADVLNAGRLIDASNVVMRSQVLMKIAICLSLAVVLEKDFAAQRDRRRRIGTRVGQHLANGLMKREVDV